MLKLEEQLDALNDDLSDLLINKASDKLPEAQFHYIHSGHEGQLSNFLESAIIELNTWFYKAA